METKFRHIIENDFSFLKDSKFILAVSGGVDSMVLLNLCHLLNLHFEVAHCNYQLRGMASDADEALVKKTCKELHIPFHLKKFDLGTPSNSIQTAARTLRYKWFDELLASTESSYMMLAHHLNDQLETVLINLSRTTGIDGLRGMLPLQQNRIRPMLHFEKEEIIAYAKANNINWREDESNSKDNYKRNFIRHRIAPLMEELHPNFWQNLNQSIQLLQSQSNNLKQLYETERSAVSIHGDHSQIELSKIKEWHKREILVPILAEFGITSSTSQALSDLTIAENGKKLETDTHAFIKLDHWIYLYPIQTNKILLKIEKFGCYSIGGIHIELKQFEGNQYDTTKSLIQLDRDKIKFPIRIRSIEDGDRFQPLGMKGKKLVNDYLKDRKVNKISREHTLVVISDDTIVAVLNHGINEQFKIDSDTKYILEIGTFVESKT